MSTTDTPTVRTVTDMLAEAPTPASQRPVPPGLFRDLLETFRTVKGATVNVKDFGAVGDGSHDDTAAIQAAITFIVALLVAGLGAPMLYLPSGIYKISDTLQAVVSGAFSRLVIQGDGPRYRAGASYIGTAIVPTFTDARPCINIQGQRFPLIHGIWFHNATGAAYIDAHQLGTVSSDLDPSVGTNWEYAANLDTQFAPNCAISIDGWSGTQPGTHYPTNQLTYGQNFTIGPEVTYCGFSGFVNHIVNQPCNADGNGDYLKVGHCWFEKYKSAISLGNSQGRNVGIEDCEFSFGFQRVVTNAHGKQIGKWGGVMKNCGGFDEEKWFQFGAATTGPVKIISCYSESLRTIADVAQTGSTVEYDYAFEGCDFKFNTQTDTLGVPRSVLTGGNSGSFRFKGCTFSQYDSVVGISPVNTTIEDCKFRPNSARTNMYEKFAHNFLGGGLVLPRLRANSAVRINCKPYNQDTGALATVVSPSDRWPCDRTQCALAYGDILIPTGATTWDSVINPHARQPAAGSTSGTVIAKAGNTLSVAGKELTIVFGARSDATFLNFGPLTGDVIYDDSTGIVFFVRSRVGLTVIAVAQNGYKAGTLDALFSTSSGAMYVGNSRIYTPAKPLFGTFGAGSASITACGTSSQITLGSASYDSDIADGDIIPLWADIDAWLTTIANGIISSHSSALQTITLAGGATVRAQTNRRIPYVVRTGPTSV